MMKKIFLYFSIFLTLFPALSIEAQEMSKRDALKLRYPDSYLDTVKVEKIFMLNDYTSIGFEAGVNFNRMTFNPSYTQDWRYVPEYYELTMTKYGKLFGYMPYFGVKLGVAYGHQGYKLREDEETQSVATVNGASEVDYKYLELPLMSVFHYDMPNFKIYAEVGPYAGYRLSIKRIGDLVDPDIATVFLDRDRRFDYGLKGGVGFSIVLSPFEFFVNGKLRYSLNPVFDPDAFSKYYYKYAYPFDVMVSAGIQFQLTKRTGKTAKMLKEEAKMIVNERYNGNAGTDR